MDFIERILGTSKKKISDTLEKAEKNYGDLAKEVAPTVNTNLSFSIVVEYYKNGDVNTRIVQADENLPLDSKLFENLAKVLYYMKNSCVQVLLNSLDSKGGSAASSAALLRAELGKLEKTNKPVVESHQVLGDM
jgi:hypothetical protein